MCPQQCCSALLSHASDRCYFQNGSVESKQMIYLRTEVTDTWKSGTPAKHRNRITRDALADDQGFLAVDLLPADRPISVQRLPFSDRSD